MSARPWESAQGSDPWQQANPLYARTCAIHRAVTSNTSGAPVVGDVGYSGEGQNTDSTGSGGETVIYASLPCSIQGRAMGKVTATGVIPADSPGPPVWIVFVPASSAAKGTIRDRDILIDDEGYRYSVAAAYFSSFGFRLNSIRLEN